MQGLPVMLLRAVDPMWDAYLSTCCNVCYTGQGLWPICPWHSVPEDSLGVCPSEGQRLGCPMGAAVAHPTHHLWLPKDLSIFPGAVPPCVSYFFWRLRFVEVEVSIWSYDTLNSCGITMVPHFVARPICALILALQHYLYNSVLIKRKLYVLVLYQKKNSCLSLWIISHELSWSVLGSCVLMIRLSHDHHKNWIFLPIFWSCILGINVLHAPCMGCVGGRPPSSLLGLRHCLAHVPLCSSGYIELLLASCGTYSVTSSQSVIYNNEPVNPALSYTIKPQLLVT